MANIIAIANQKGGVGKTTTTANVGTGLAAQGKRVLLVDMDSQANLTMCLGFDPDQLDTSLYNLMDYCIEQDAAPDMKGSLLTAEGVDLLPSSILLAGIDLKLMNALNREYVLKTILDSVREQYDYILIDCQPSLGLLTINALSAADSVLIPMQAQYLSAKGLEMLIHTIAKVKRRTNPNLSIEGILITMLDKRTRMGREIVEELVASSEGMAKVFDSTIPVSIKAAETSAAGKSLFQYDPRCKLAMAYGSLVKELMTNG